MKLEVCVKHGFFAKYDDRWLLLALLPAATQRHPHRNRAGHPDPAHPGGALQTNPPAHAEPPWDSASTRLLVQETCFDCHSNHTVWPWYSRIAPVSWLITQDVIRGRRHLNFSDWQSGSQSSFLAERAVSAVQRGAMPPSYYVWMHPKANLSAAQKQQLIQGLERSLH
jgi:hypothetical protein